MCKATLDFVEHHQSTSLASLLQRRQAQRLHEHVVDTRGVPKPVEDEAFRSPLRGTASILAMFFCEYGSQTDAAYSNSGRTKTLYAFSLMLEALIFKLRLRKPRALFALEQVLLMWSSQLTVLFIVTPRYLADETVSKVCPWRT